MASAAAELRQAVSDAGVRRRLGPKFDAAHLHRVVLRVVLYLVPLECIARTVAQAVAGVVPRGRAQRHSGNRSIFVASAPVRVVAINRLARGVDPAMMVAT